MNKYKSKFLDEWLVNEHFKNWIKKDPNDDHSAYWKYCCKSFSVSGRGINHVQFHMNGSKDKNKSPPSEGGQKILSFDPSQNSEEIKTGQAKTTVSSSNQKQSTISSSITKENVLRAEIFWALEILNYSYSLNSCAKKGKLFSAMFPDSNVAQNFQIASTMASYVTYYGLAPYFKEMLFDELKTASYIVLCFDESYNGVIKKGQLDVLVRYWDVRLNKVNTRYVKSEFMGKAAANDVLAKFEAASSELDRTKFIQVSSDGPNVNLKFTLRKTPRRGFEKTL